ncbi:MAG: glycosyltransferase family 2 protein [Gaiellaceae bacterium]
MTDVTVSIVHASGPELTLECIESLEADRARRCAAQIVVLDNASNDSFAERVRERFPQVRLIEQPWRAGFSANQNTIVRSSKSRYVFILNPDTQVPPGTIDGLVDYLDANPNVGVVGPLIRGFDGIQQGSAWRLVSVPVQLVWALTLGRFGAVVSPRSTPRRVGAVSACAMLVRRDAFEAVGFFDEAYFMFNEEADLARRLEGLGLQRHYLSKFEVLHHGQTSTADVPERQVNEVWASLDLYLERYHSPAVAKVLRGLTGLGYALAVAAAEVAGRLPARITPASVSAGDPRIYRLHVRNAFRGTRAPGLRELAAEWNRSHDVRPAPSACP